MKKLLLLLIIGQISINIVHAKKTDGYYISNSNDTIKVTFNIPQKFFIGDINFEAMQIMVKYYDSIKIKHILTPEMAKELSFNYEGHNIRMLSCNNNLGIIVSIFSDNSRLFLQLITDGKLKLYKFYQTKGSSGMMGPSGMVSGGFSYSIENYIMQKEEGNLFKASWFSFRKDMMNYLSDCPSIAQKIDNKTYRSSDIVQIVDEYNTKCK